MTGHVFTLVSENSDFSMPQEGEQLAMGQDIECSQLDKFCWKFLPVTHQLFLGFSGSKSFADVPNLHFVQKVAELVDAL